MNNPTIPILLTIAVALLLCGLVLLIVTMSVNSKDYKYYKVTYEAIKNCTYVMVRNGSYGQQTYHKPEETNPYTNDEIIFFNHIHRRGDVESIKLLTPSNTNHYIHNKGGSDLYARYWFKKIVDARDKYNHELWVTTQPIRREYVTGSIEHRESFKFFN
jgi:hypothetical protein